MYSSVGAGVIIVCLCQLVLFSACLLAMGIDTIGGYDGCHEHAGDIVDGNDTAADIKICRHETEYNNVTEFQARMVRSRTRSATFLAHTISNAIKENGFAFLPRTTASTDNMHALSNAVLDIETYHQTHALPNVEMEFDYKLGNVGGRSEVLPGLYKVSGAPKRVLVTGHSEASYLEYSPLYLVFSCAITVPDIAGGGHTIVYSIDALVDALKATAIGAQLLTDVLKHGVKYIRNDVCAHNEKLAPLWRSVNYPPWQRRFPNMTRWEITQLLESKDQLVTWTKDNTLKTEWYRAGFRLHPGGLADDKNDKNDNGHGHGHGKYVWFNQLFGMNGRYFDAHRVPAMATVPLKERPLHTWIGDHRPLSDDEYVLLEAVHNRIAILIPWQSTGDILAIDNFVYQHGRMPFHSNRSCVVHWGPGVNSKTNTEYVPHQNPQHTPSGTAPAININEDNNNCNADVGGSGAGAGAGVVDVFEDEIRDTFIESVTEDIELQLKMVADLNAVFLLLHYLSFKDSHYMHISGRIRAGVGDDVGDHVGDGIILYPDELPADACFEWCDLYRVIYQHRPDVNVILHAYVPDIMALTAVLGDSLLPIDQSYYMLYPTAYHRYSNLPAFEAFIANETINNSGGRHPLNSFVIILRNNGILCLGATAAQAFTALYYAIRAAQTQVLTLSSIHNRRREIIFPDESIIARTIEQSLNFNPVFGYGYLEFAAWKRRYQIGTDFDLDLSCEVSDVLVVEEEEEEEEAPMPAEERLLRQNLTNLYALMDELGWTETIYTHITAHLSGSGTGDEILMNAYGIEYGDITPQNLLKVKVSSPNGGAAVVDCGDSAHRRCCTNPSGMALHGAIHRARADARIVLHAHHPAISAVSVSKFGLVLFSERYAQMLSPVTYHDFDSLSLAVNATKLIANLGNESNVLILRNHGIIVMGDNTEEAFNRVYYSIRAAQIQVKMMGIYSRPEFMEMIEDNKSKQ